MSYQDQIDAVSANTKKKKQAKRLKWVIGIVIAVFALVIFISSK